MGGREGGWVVDLKNGRWRVKTDSRGWKRAVELENRQWSMKTGSGMG